MNRKVLTNK